MPDTACLNLDDLIEGAARAVDVDGLMSDVRHICQYDRYQASRGIEAAAEIVAERAAKLGVSDVHLERYPADGARRWWTYSAPTSWTPLVARLEIRAGDEVRHFDHAREPFSIATHSAPTTPGGTEGPVIPVSTTCRNKILPGAVALVTAEQFSQPGLLADLADRGAIGFITDAAARGVDAEYAGRIELAPTSTLFGFSVTSAEMRQLERHAATGATAHAIVEIDTTALMPVVTGVLPGRLSDEVWLTAHLCHPRPSANDNASGVSALLGVAAVHRSLRRAHENRRSIRLVWGPEFVGMAATLHSRAAVGATLPSAVINVDMVGENQALCGGPFVLERSPDTRVSLINPLAEYITRAVFTKTDTHPGSWRSGPFLGFSDHALFADPSIGSPAVHLCHTTDRFNHSAGDTISKVSAIEMHRATTVAAALAWSMASREDLAPSLLRRVVANWRDAELVAARKLACRYAGGENPDWGRHLIRYVEEHTRAVEQLAEDVPPGRPLSSLPEEPALAPRWTGPVNIRALIADLPARRKATVADALQADRFNQAVLLNFAIRTDGYRSEQQIKEETSFALRQPIADATADLLLAVLTESGTRRVAPECH